MSRDIDLDNLSDEDKEYIAQRPWIAEEAVRQGRDNPLEGFEMTRPGEEPEVTSQEETPEEEEEEAEDEADTEVVDYDEWGYDDLRVEAKARGLKSTGSAADIKERLRENDLAEA